MRERERLVGAIQDLMTAMASARACEPEPWLQTELSMAQLRALFVLHAVGPMRVGEVGAHLRLSANATTGVLDRLERAALVERARDPSDRRATLIRPTEAGTGLADSLLNAGTQHLGRVLSRLSIDELRGLHLGMAAVIRCMQAVDEAPALDPGVEGGTNSAPGSGTSAAGRGRAVPA